MGFRELTRQIHSDAKKRRYALLFVSGDLRRSSALRADERVRVVPNIGFSARSAVEPSLERHPFGATSSSRTRVTAAHHRPEKLQRFSAGRRVRSVRDDAQLAPVMQDQVSSKNNVR